MKIRVGRWGSVMFVFVGGWGKKEKGSGGGVKEGDCVGDMGSRGVRRVVCE